MIMSIVGPRETHDFRKLPSEQQVNLIKTTNPLVPYACWVLIGACHPM